MGQCNRNAETAVEHIIQERVARVVIILAVAAKIHPIKQHMIECGPSDSGLRLRDQGGDTARQLFHPGRIHFNFEIRILRASDNQGGADQIDFLVFNVGRYEDGKRLNQIWRDRVLHTSMLAKTMALRIGPDVPWAGTSGYERNILRAMKKTFAGRSPSRRMK